MVETRLDRALRAAGIPIIGVSVGTEADRSTWVVQYDPSATAQQKSDGAALVATFNPTDPGFAAADLDAEVTRALDQERLISAVVWTILDTYSPPATVAKYNAARTKIVSNYKATPWKP